MNNDLLTIFKAYGYREVKDCFRQFHREFIAGYRKWKNEAEAEKALIETESGGWVRHDVNDGPPPENHEWMEINGQLYIRPFEAANHAPTSQEQANLAEPLPKTDLSMKPTDKVCPLCGEVMAWEPICPGCKLGRQGFKGRYVCMADFDHTYYMLREGLDLPNR